MKPFAERCRQARLEDIDNLIAEYYDEHLAGGSLHLVLDDDNWAATCLLHVVKFAADEGDVDGYELAIALIRTGYWAARMSGD